MKDFLWNIKYFNLKPKVSPDKTNKFLVFLYQYRLEYTKNPGSTG